MILDDEKYKSLRNSLRSLPRLKAKSDFEARLLQRIKETEKGVIPSRPEISKEPAFKNWLSALFRPSFAPALGLTVVLLITVVVYFAYFSKMGKNENSVQLSSSDKQGEFVIYVRKDTETSSYSENYPKEYSAITTDGTTRGETISEPTETPSDYLSRPEPKTGYDEVRPDRISEEQKIEMQRSVDLDKAVDSKGEEKEDVMKKESKGDMKRESKGMLKTESKETPFNIKDDGKNENSNKEGDEVNQEVQPPFMEKANEVRDKEKAKNDSIILGKSIKDSVKTKTEADQKEDSTEDHK